MVLGAAGAPGAQELPGVSAAERIDDPKLERRLGTRVDLAPNAGPAGEVVAEPAPPRGPARAVVNVPRLKIGFRRFTFVGIAAAATPMGVPHAVPGEVFNSVSLDFYPVSSFWRLGLSTQYGWEDGTFRDNGDAFIAQSISFGGPLPGRRFTPFAEGYGGGGLMQRTHANLNYVGTAYGQLGFDVGTEVFLAKYALFSVAVGYLHAANGFVKNLAYSSLSADMWSFKLGVGL
jgi:hypothetical protein